jgi:peptidoglycan hydrolase-like protein with peptidoglycan-binding domain
MKKLSFNVLGLCALASILCVTQTFAQTVSTSSSATTTVAVATSTTSVVASSTDPIAVYYATGYLALPTNLSYNLRNSNPVADVKALQDFLQAQGFFQTEPTGYFGTQTLTAAKAFQTAQNIIGTGYVGPITRARIAQLTTPSSTTNANKASTTSVISVSTSTSVTTTSSSVAKSTLVTSGGGATASAAVSTKSGTNATVSAAVSVTPLAGVTPYVTIISPNGGETFQNGSSTEITWSYGNITQSFAFTFALYQKNTGTTTYTQVPFHQMVASVDSTNWNLNYNNNDGTNAGGGSWKWRIPNNMAGGQYKLCITASSTLFTGGSLNACSANPFTINYVNPTVTLVSPNGGESFMAGSSTDIKWTSSTDPGWNTWMVELYKQDPASSSTLDFVSTLTSYVSDVHFPWTIPTNLPSGQYKILVNSVYNEPVIQGYSANYFTVNGLPPATSCVTAGSKVWADANGDGKGFASCDTVVNGTFDLSNSYCVSSGGLKANLKPDGYNRPNRYYNILTGLGLGDTVDVYVTSTNGNLLHCTPLTDGSIVW